MFNHGVRRIGLAVLLTLASTGMPSHAQDHTLKLEVGLPPGGNIDLIARVLAEKLRVSLKQPVIVENRPGAQARLVVQTVKTAPPDGNTLLVTPGSIIYLYPHVFKKLGYDPFVDLTPVAQVLTWDLGFAVPGNSPIRTLPEFIAWAKANPSKAFFGTPSAGSIQHFLGVTLSKTTQTPLEHIGYKGASEVVAALVGAQIPGAILNIGELLALQRAGKVRILATFGAKRAPELPDVPVASELGYRMAPGIGWAAIYAPANTAPQRVAQLNAAIVKALAEPDVRDKMAQLAMAPIGGTPKQLDDLGRGELEQWRDVVRESGFTAD